MDFTNAFQHASWPTQHATLAKLLRPKYIALLAKLYRMGSVCLLEKAEGSPDFLPSAGILMGDPGSVSLFAHSFKKPTSRWNMKLYTS